MSVLVILMLLFALNVSYRALRDRDARRLSLLAESRLEDGDRILATQLALASTRQKLLYRPLVPEALSVLSDAVHAYDMPSESRLEKAFFYRFNYSTHLSMDISPDGKYLAATNEEGDIIVWDTQSGRELHSIHASFNASDSKVKFLNDSMLLVYSFAGSQCFSLDTFNTVWENPYLLSIDAITYTLGDDDYKMTIVRDAGDTDGLTNLTLSEWMGQTVLLTAELKKGLVLREAETGQTLASLPREKIDTLLPDDVLFYRDFTGFVFRSLITMQDSSEIGYDPEKDLFLIPCYKKIHYNPDNRDLINTVYCGLLEWSPGGGEVFYNNLEVSPDAFLESIAYGPGRILKLSEEKDAAGLYCYDEESGELLWNYKTVESPLLREISRRTGFTEEGILILEDNSILVLDPENGQEKKRYEADLRYDEDLLMLLDGSREFGPSQMQDLLFMTTQGRICTVNGSTVSISEKSLTLTDDTDNKWTDCLYIPAGSSCAGKAFLYDKDTNGIFQYEVGSVNNRFTPLLTREIDSSYLRFSDLPEVSPVDSSRILVRDQEGIWEMYDLSQEGPGLLWSIRPEEIPLPSETEYEDAADRPDPKNLTYLGRDPADGSLVLYSPLLDYFPEIAPDSGDISYLLPPQLDKEGSGEQKKSRILAPVITGTDLFYISEVLEGQTCSFSLFKMDRRKGITGRFDICEGKTITQGNPSYKLYTDISGRYAYLVSDCTGPYFIDTKKKGNTVKSYDILLDIPDKWENTFFYSGVRNVCSFDPEGRYFAVNFKPLNQIFLYDTKGEQSESWTYFNTNISEMFFDEDNLMVLTSDGRVLRLSLHNMKLLASQTISDTACNFKGISEDRDAYWIMDKHDTLYCVDSDSLVPRIRIRDTAALDLAGDRVFTVQDTGQTLTLGYMPLLSAEEILEEARALTESREMTREEEIYYGID